MKSKLEFDRVGRLCRAYQRVPKRGSGDQGMLVWWSIRAGVHVEPHATQMSRSCGCSKARWVRLADEQRVCAPGDVVVIPGGTEHEGWFREDSEVIDFFAPRARTSYSAVNPSTSVKTEHSGAKVCEVAPTYLIRDNDRAFGAVFMRAWRAMKRGWTRATRIGSARWSARRRKSAQSRSTNRHIRCGLRWNAIAGSGYDDVVILIASSASANRLSFSE